jgi:DNA polymerase beta
MNRNIIDNLKIIEEYEKINGNIFKYNSYKKTINLIEMYDKEIKELKDLEEIKGIGKNIKEKIIEYIEKGKIERVEEIKSDEKYELYTNLNKIYGVGPVKIKELVLKNVKFSDLDENTKLLNNKQKIGLKYFKDLEERIPYDEGKKHNEIIKNTLKDINKNIEYEMVGSYRRKKEDMGDIDILIKEDDKIILNEIIEKLVERGYIIEKLANGKKKFMGISKINEKTPVRRIDILICEKEHYYFTLLYFTGSYNHNIIMRKRAIEKGLSLSEYGFTDLKTNKIVKYEVNSEEDIFKILDMKYLKPENRL